MKHSEKQSAGFLQRLRQRFTNQSKTNQTAASSGSRFMADLDKAAGSETPEATASMSRVARQQAKEQQFKDAKTIHPNMRRRLNWAIGIVAILIVIVYLVLFFV